MARDGQQHPSHRRQTLSSPTTRGCLRRTIDEPPHVRCRTPRRDFEGMDERLPADSHVTVQVGRGRGAWDPRWQAERNETAAEPSFCRRDSPSGRTLRPGSRLLHSLTVSPALASALNLRSGGTAARMRMGKSLSARSFARLGPTRHSARAVAVCLLVGETGTAADEQESSAVRSAVQQRQAEDETRQLKQDR